jgi:Family of unknown function (DUF5329)
MAVAAFAGVFALAPAPGLALPPEPAAAAEIDFLLAAIGDSRCEFFRNGDWHDASHAQAHVREKYRLLVARDRVRTAEEFIELAATRSSLSGRAYAIRCPGEATVSSSSWLQEKLHRYRDAHGASRAGRDAPANQRSN